MSYTVIFMEGKGVSRLGQFNDKGDCRRAWRTCSHGAAIVGPDGSVLEFRSGTTQPSERALKTYAEHMKRPGGTGGAAPAPEPARAKVKVERVELEVEEDEVDEEPAPKPLPPAPTPPAPVAPRPAEVTHAVAPATGAVVAGDDVERITPAAPVTCGAKGCTEAPGTTRSNTNPLLVDFCPRDRKTAHDRSRASSLTLAQVAAHLRAGTLPPPDPTRVASGRKGGLGMKKAAAKRAAKVVAHRDPKPAKPARAPSPARSLAAGLERVKRHAAVVDALGGVEVAEQLAAVVRDAGGVNVVVEALTELRSVA